MDKYDGRKGTFKDWPKSATANPTVESLVKAGFFYTGKRDQVECFECHQRLEGWDEEDDALQEHARHSPSCAFISTFGYINTKQKEGRVAADNCLGIPPSPTGDLVDAGASEIMNQSMKYPFYQIDTNRFDTFEGWPRDRLDPGRLASQGFFFFNGRRGEVIQCYVCGIELDATVTEHELQRRHRERNCPAFNGEIRY